MAGVSKETPRPEEPREAGVSKDGRSAAVGESTIAPPQHCLFYPIAHAEPKLGMARRSTSFNARTAATTRESLAVPSRSE
jgi:hypothetical protein